MNKNLDANSCGNKRSMGSNTSVAKKYEFKAIKNIVSVLGFAISQSGIAAQTPTLMQGFEVKERREHYESS